MVRLAITSTAAIFLLACSGCAVPAASEQCSLRDKQIRIIEAPFGDDSCFSYDIEYQGPDENFNLFVNSVNKNIKNGKLGNEQTVVFIRNDLFDRKEIRDNANEIVVHFDKRTHIRRWFDEEYDDNFDWQNYPNITLDQYLKYQDSYATNAELIDPSPDVILREQSKHSDIPLDIFWLFVRSSPGGWEGQSRSPARYVARRELEDMEILVSDAEELINKAANGDRN